MWRTAANVAPGILLGNFIMSVNIHATDHAIDVNKDKNDQSSLHFCVYFTLINQTLTAMIRTRKLYLYRGFVNGFWTSVCS